MPGPTPKNPAIRQRQNKAATRAILPADGAARRKTPALPKHHEWDALTVAWWRDVWRSPMASLFLQADLHGLYLLAELIDRFWAEPTAALAGEIRLQRQCFGLTPIDRRRLEWEVERPEAGARERRPTPATAPAGDDPRRLLAVV